MKGDIKKLLEKIRNSDEGTKKKWVVAASSITMAIVIASWLLLSNSIVKPVNETTSQKDTGIAYQSIMKEIGNMTKKLNSANSITIEK
ncbi:MAG: hypothetical protein NTW60_00890 [Candidatus Wolfebacteria bacterium]|nr:hypothetical protein [Candidatus Wolfebacteria bacterium]